MATYLFNWNPRKGWQNFEEIFEQYQKQGFINDDWSCGKRRSLPPGSRFFLIHLGEEPKGIVASGITLSEPHKGSHWSGQKGKTALYVDVHFTIILRPLPKQVLPLALLQNKLPLPHNWTPFASGTIIPKNKATVLERIWQDHLRYVSDLSEEIFDLAAPTPPGRGTFTIERIIRDTALANKVKRIHKFKCQICGTSIKVPKNKSYAEGHHIQPLGKPHNGHDVKENILCVCPNCHVVLDRGAIRLRLPQIKKSAAHKISQRYIDYHNAKIYQA